VTNEFKDACRTLAYGWAALGTTRHCLSASGLGARASGLGDDVVGCARAGCWAGKGARRWVGERKHGAGPCELAVGEGLLG
jgi:hypothetical protein